ncbi:Swt1 family HEPN domain-containing protein [Arthrobacter sp. OVS8]|nr:Swt1 family HEPN domain-containing protein [Arthrobacter sp. OVS8]
MGLSNREYVGRALDTLATSLGSYIASVLNGVAPGISWPKLLEHKDSSAGRAPMTYSPTDLSVQLRVMTESLGSLGYPFNLGHDARSYTSELRQTRNLWAHNETFNDADTFRALDTAGRLAKHLGLDGAAQALGALLDDYKLRDTSGRVSVTSETGVGSAAGEKPEPQPLEQPMKQHPVSVEITAAESLSYAMVHNGFKFVRQIKISNPGTEIRGAVVRVEVFASTGRISEDFQQYVDLAAGQAIVLDDVDVHVSAATMDELSDKQPGRVVVTIESSAAGPAATELGKAEARLQLLPAQLWIAGRGLVSYEFLAAFVQPHHPAISKLVSEAADLLEEATGSSSLDGYMDSAERVDEIVFALAQAASKRDIRYSMPPASWGVQGQQIRTLRKFWKTASEPASIRLLSWQPRWSSAASPRSCGS